MDSLFPIEHTFDKAKHCDDQEDADNECRDEYGELDTLILSYVNFFFDNDLSIFDKLISIHS